MVHYTNFVILTLSKPIRWASFFLPTSSLGGCFVVLRNLYSDNSCSSISATALYALRSRYSRRSAAPPIASLWIFVVVASTFALFSAFVRVVVWHIGAAAWNSF